VEDEQAGDMDGSAASGRKYASRESCR
jgi:hypothetical protein